MNTKFNPKDIVIEYIKALDEYNYNKAKKYLNEKVKIHGPAGEAFSNPTDFINMLQRFRGKYDMKKVFVDGNDVCVLYDLKTSNVTAFMASWYQIDNNKIISVRTIFDSKLFPRDEN
ncbi:MAG: nuclear transport factor 2 family protein [Candidatus Thorarchaeota archaeon]